MWSLGWVADYPGRNDFLGVLLASDSTNNYGGWSSPAFDAADRRRRTPRPTRPPRPRRTTRPRRSSRAMPRSSRSATARAGRSPATGCSGRARTASGSCAWRGWHGPTDASLGRRRRGGRRPARDRRPRPSPPSSFATFGTPSATGDFGVGHRVPAAGHRRSGRSVGRSSSSRSPTRSDRRSSTPSRRRAPGRWTLSYTLRIADQGHILPNTPIRRRLADLAGRRPGRRGHRAPRRRSCTRTSGSTGRRGAATSSASTGTRATTRSGTGRSTSARTGRRAGGIGLLGVTETEPVDFFIYADQDAFYDALGPATRENVGGQADAGIRTLFALIRPREIDDAVGRDRHPARAHPPRLRHGRDEPVPLPAALAQRGPRGVPERGLRRPATGATSRPPRRTAR